MRIKLLVTSFLLLMGCTTVQNISPSPIAVPAGLTENDVKLPKLAHGEVVTDGVVKALFQQNADPRRRDSWHLEGMESSVIYAGYENRERSMNVAVRYCNATPISSNKMPCCDSEKANPEELVLNCINPHRCV